jgi:6-phosphogluconolactonase
MSRRAWSRRSLPSATTARAAPSPGCRPSRPCRPISGTSSTAEIIVHPSGRFVYGSNRGHDSIVIFAVDPGSGELDLVGWEPTQGGFPRNFNIDPSGSLLLAANQNTNTIVSFYIHPQTGRLRPTKHITTTPTPVCIAFGPVAPED